MSDGLRHRVDRVRVEVAHHRLLRCCGDESRLAGHVHARRADRLRSRGEPRSSARHAGLVILRGHACVEARWLVLGLELRLAERGRVWLVGDYWQAGAGLGSSLLLGVVCSPL